MHVEIEQGLIEQTQCSDAALLAGFTQRGGLHARITLDMSTGLKPSLQLAVVSQECGPAIRRQHPGRRGDMAVRRMPVRTIGRARNEIQRVQPMTALDDVGWLIVLQ